MLEPSSRGGPSGRDDDRALARAAAAGDADARAILIDRLACILPFLRIKNQRLPTPLQESDLLDLFQDTLLDLWTKLPQFRGDSKIETWACGFALRTWWRARARRLRRTTTVDPDHLVDETRSSSLDGLDADLIREQVHQLGPPVNEIIERKLFQGGTFEGIAQDLGMPVPSVKSCYYRAFQGLHVRLRSLRDGGDS